MDRLAAVLGRVRATQAQNSGLHHRTQQELRLIHAEVGTELQSLDQRLRETNARLESLVP